MTFHTDQTHLGRERARADAEFYRIQQESQANQVLKLKQLYSATNDVDDMIIKLDVRNIILYKYLLLINTKSLNSQ